MRNVSKLTIVLTLFISCSVVSQSLKIATYNIYFLDDGISPERKHNLQTVIRELDADVIAFQEINNPAALENILTPNYSIAMIDDTAEVQEIALAVRIPLMIKSYSYIFPDTLFDDAFPRTRNLLQVELEGYGRDFYFLVHHFKSRSGGRHQTDERRISASRMIVRHIRQNLSGQNVILLGDFNDNPDDRTLNILEYGSFDAPAGIDEAEDTFLYNTSEALVEKDYCSWGYNYHFNEIQGDTFDLVIAGSRDENNKWRDKDYDYWKDVEIKEILIDQILVSMNLKSLVKKVGILHTASAVQGTPSKARFTNYGIEYPRRGSFASDHLPVWVLLEF
jgi:endonuclease/exonuclease/phosphatase family metal-dependent hydrolase